MLSTGIDISSNNITVSELQSSRNSILLRNSVSFEVSPEAIEKGELQDTEALSKGLKDVWRKFRISGRNVNVGLSNLKAIVREVEMPLVDDEEIKNSLRYQINDFIPIPKDNLLYDYYIVKKGDGFSKLMIAGAMKSMVMNVITAIREAGLIAQAIDLNCFSLFRTIEKTYGISRNQTNICAVNIGRDVSIIEIIESDTLKFPRFISNSVSSFENNISKSTGIDLVSAEASLNSFDFQTLCINKNDKTTDNASDPDKALRKSIDSTASSFIDEIKMSIDHYMQENPGNRIEKILVSGENLKNISKYISFRTDYNVEILDISSNFSLELINNKSALYKNTASNGILNPLAIGMALRGI